MPKEKVCIIVRKGPSWQDPLHGASWTPKEFREWKRRKMKKFSKTKEKGK